MAAGSPFGGGTATAAPAAAPTAPAAPATAPAAPASAAPSSLGFGGGDPFSAPSGISGEKITQFNGELLMVKPTEVIPEMNTKRGLSNTKRRMNALPLERKGEVAGYMDLEDAIDFAEAWVYEASDRFTFNDRHASWRRNQKPSDKQVQFARNLGVVGADQMTKARLSDEISIALASKVLDTHMAKRSEVQA